MIALDLPPPVPPVIAEQEQAPAEKPSHSAFLTYAHDDPRFVDEVNEALKAANVRTYLDKEFITVGNIDNQIIAAIKKVEFQIIFCTEAASKSEYCQNEVHFASSNEVKQIPIIIDRLERMEWFRFHRLDLHLSIFVDGFDHSEPAILGITRELLRLMGRPSGYK